MAANNQVSTTDYKNLPVLREAGDLNAAIIDAASADVPAVTIAEGSTATVAAGSKIQLHAVTYPAGVGSVAWTSGTTAKATVDEDTGEVTGVAAGDSVITATFTYKTGVTKTATCTVTVTA